MIAMPLRNVNAETGILHVGYCDNVGELQKCHNKQFVMISNSYVWDYWDEMLCVPLVLTAKGRGVGFTQPFPPIQGSLDNMTLLPVRCHIIRGSLY